MCVGTALWNGTEPNVVLMRIMTPALCSETRSISWKHSIQTRTESAGQFSLKLRNINFQHDPFSDNY